MGKMHLSRTGRELFRHLVARIGLSQSYLRIRKAMGQNVDHLFAPSLAERFSAIYENRVWLNDRECGSLSGFGSDFQNTKLVRDRIPQLLQRIGSQTVLDVGCGDFNWMSMVDIPGAYIGVDIVPEVIQANITAYGSQTKTFIRLDATRDPLPFADTVICREILFHLSFADIWSLVENVRRSKGTCYFIATNDDELTLNADILSGDFRMLNLRKRPFSFPAPVLSIPDNTVVPDRVLAVWNVADLPSQLSI